MPQPWLLVFQFNKYRAANTQATQTDLDCQNASPFAKQSSYHPFLLLTERFQPVVLSRICRHAPLDESLFVLADAPKPDWETNRVRSMFYGVAQTVSFQ